MKIARVKSSVGIGYVRDKLIPPLGYTLSEYETVLKDMLARIPDQVLMLIQFSQPEDSDEPVVESFLIAYVTPAQPDQVQLLQTWTREGTEFTLSDRLVTWAENQGAKKIKTELRPDQTCPSGLDYELVCLVMEHQIKKG